MPCCTRATTATSSKTVAFGENQVRHYVVGTAIHNPLVFVSVRGVAVFCLIQKYVARKRLRARRGLLNPVQNPIGGLLESQQTLTSEVNTVTTLCISSLPSLSLSVYVPVSLSLSL